MTSLVVARPHLNSVCYVKKLISQPVSYLLYLCVENVSCELCTSKLKLRSPEFKKWTQGRPAKDQPRKLNVSKCNRIEISDLITSSLQKLIHYNVNHLIRILLLSLHFRFTSTRRVCVIIIFWKQDHDFAHQYLHAMRTASISML